MKHYFQGSLKPLNNTGQHIGPKGMVVTEQPGKRLTAIAEELMFSTIPEKDWDKYICQLQHIGTVEMEG